MTKPKINWAQNIVAICAVVTVVVLLYNQFGNPLKTNSPIITNSKSTNQSNTNKKSAKHNENTKLNERNYKNSVDISGVWKCRRANSYNKSIVSTMKITQSGKKIKVKGIGQEWTGEGQFDGNEGYYDWEFSNGKTGRTTIYLDADRNLYGEVKGQITPWTFIGTR